MLDDIELFKGQEKKNENDDSVFEIVGDVSAEKPKSGGLVRLQNLLETSSSTLVPVSATGTTAKPNSRVLVLDTADGAIDNSDSPTSDPAAGGTSNLNFLSLVPDTAIGGTAESDYLSAMSDITTGASVSALVPDTATGTTAKLDSPSGETELDFLSEFDPESRSKTNPFLEAEPKLNFFDQFDPFAAVAEQPVLSRGKSIQ